jgi:hypothetical protein
MNAQLSLPADQFAPLALSFTDPLFRFSSKTSIIPKTCVALLFLNSQALLGQAAMQAPQP